MRELKLFNIRIEPKDKKELEDGEVCNFKIVAETPIKALTKMMALPDIDYMYDPRNDEIIISNEGVVY